MPPKGKQGAQGSTGSPAPPRGGATSSGAHCSSHASSQPRERSTPGLEYATPQPADWFEQTIQAEEEEEDSGDDYGSSFESQLSFIEKKLEECLSWIVDNQPTIQPRYVAFMRDLGPLTSIVFGLAHHQFFTGKRLRQKLITFIHAGGNPR